MRANAAWGLRALVFAVVVLACLPALNYGFLDWDDPLHLTRNALVLDPASASFKQHLTTRSLGYPVPLTLLSYRLEHALFGMNPRVFHATNVVLHGLIAALTLVLGRRLGLSLLAALTGALFFGLHPVAAEPVSWVTGRKDLLAACFGALLLLCAGSAQRPIRALAPLCYGLSLLSKPSLLLLPLLVPLVSPTQGRASTLGYQRWLRLWPYGLIAAPLLLMGYLGQKAQGATLPGYLPLSRLGGAFYALGHHASLALLWEEATVKYAPLPWPPESWLRTSLAALVVVGGLSLAAWRLRAPFAKPARVGALLCLLAYLPVSSLLVPLTRYLADSYVYLPLLGMGLVLGAGLDRVRSGMPEASGRLFWILPPLLGAVLLLGFVQSSARFASDLALWSHARDRFPGQPRICRQWSNAVAEEVSAEAGLLAIDQCIAQFGQALFARNRAVLLQRLGRPEEARRWLERAARSSHIR